MRIVTAVSDPNHPGFLALKKSCPDLESIPYESHYGSGILDKVWAMSKFIKDVDDEELVMFVDGYDVLFMSRLSEDDVELLIDADIDIIFNAEKAVFPSQELKAVYQAQEQTMPIPLHPSKYLNSGCYVGTAYALKQWLQLMITIFGKHPGADDQSAASVLYLASNLDIALDESNELFQCYSFVNDDEYVYEPGRMTNTITGGSAVVFHGNGKTDMTRVRHCVETGIDWLRRNYEDTVDFHERNRKNFEWLMSPEANNPRMQRMTDVRAWIRERAYGFGEDVFVALWYILLDSLNKKFPGALQLLEVGVYKGQSPALWAAYFDQHRGDLTRIVACSTFAKAGDVNIDFTEEDTLTLFKQHNLDTNKLVFVKGNSTDADTVRRTGEAGAGTKFHMVYIDGGHEYDVALADLNNYGELVREGGYLVVDDCCNDTQVPRGWFGGIVTVTNAVRDYMAKPINKDRWELLFSLVHIKVYRRKPLPEGTTQEQWDRYYSDMERWHALFDGVKPDVSDQEAFAQWQMKRSMDEPNKPGYTRANND